MNICLYLGDRRGWRKIGSAEDGYVSMILNALCSSHPNMFFVRSDKKPTYKPGREEK